MVGSWIRVASYFAESQKIHSYIGIICTWGVVRLRAYAKVPSPSSTPGTACPNWLWVSTEAPLEQIQPHPSHTRRLLLVGAHPAGYCGWGKKTEGL